MKKLICALCVILSACSESPKPSTPHLIRLYSCSGTVIREWHARGPGTVRGASGEGNMVSASGLWFEDKATGNWVYASGTLTDEIEIPR